jgi:hypothetical protein
MIAFICKFTFVATQPTKFLRCEEQSTVMASENLFRLEFSFSVQYAIWNARENNDRQCTEWITSRVVLNQIVI